MLLNSPNAQDGPATESPAPMSTEPTEKPALEDAVAPATEGEVSKTERLQKMSMGMFSFFFF